MIFFFHGENTYAAQEQLKKLKERYLESTGGDFGLEQIDGESVEVDRLTGALTALPFLADSRLVIIKNLAKNKAAAEATLKVLDRIPDETVAVFYESNVDKRTSFYKTLNKQAKVTEFKPLEGGRLTTWIQNYMSRLDGEIGSREARELAERVGNDQWKLSQELRKLRDAGRPIDTELVQDLTEPSFEHTIFDMVEALSTGNTKRALELYQGLRSQAAAPLYVLSMMGWQLRNLLVVKAAGNRPPAEISKAAKMAPFVVQKSKRVVGGIEQARLEAAYAAIIEADYRIKSGGGRDEHILEQLIVTVTDQLSSRVNT